MLSLLRKSVRCAPVANSITVKLLQPYIQTQNVRWTGTYRAAILEDFKKRLAVTTIKNRTKLGDDMVCSAQHLFYPVCCDTQYLRHLLSIRFESMWNIAVWTQPMWRTWMVTMIFCCRWYQAMRLVARCWRLAPSAGMASKPAIKWRPFNVSARAGDF